jgi:hypothetical protein
MSRVGMGGARFAGTSSGHSAATSFTVVTTSGISRRSLSGSACRTCMTTITTAIIRTMTAIACGGCIPVTAGAGVRSTFADDEGDCRQAFPWLRPPRAEPSRRLRYSSGSVVNSSG